MKINFIFIISLMLLNSAKGSVLLGNAFEEFLPKVDEVSATNGFSFSTFNCGVNKGCYLSPSHCVDEDCDVFLSWRGDTDSVHFEFSYALDTDLGNDQWAAIAQSRDETMQDASLIACRHYNDTLDIVSAYNAASGYSTQLLEDVQLGLDPSSLKVTFHGARIDCEFTRYIRVDPNLPDADKVFNLTQAYFYQIGEGPSNEEGRIRKHTATPIVTPQIDISKVEVVGGIIVSPLLKAHACLMIAAWVILAGIGMIIPRYYKPAWKLEIQKMKIWFWIHRTAMQLVLVLTVCGFIIIFFYVDGFTSLGSGAQALQSSHAIIGIIVMALTLVNPVMAFFRPGPGTTKRLIFNWAHRIVGESGRFLAVVNIMTGFWIPRSELFTEKWMFWTMVGLVIFHCLIEASLYVSILMVTNKPKSKSNTYDISDSQLKLVEKIKETDNKLQTSMLFLYGIVMLVFSIFMFVAIGMK